MWIKKGVIIEPQDDLWWMKTHAMLPTIVKINDNVYKVYFSGRDSNNVSHIGYCLIKVEKDKLKVLKYGEQPVLLPGDRIVTGKHCH